MPQSATSSLPWQIAEPRRAYVSQPEGREESLRDSLRELHLIMAVLTVVIGALRRQNADCDTEIADVLERYASDRLDMQIEKLQARLTS